MLSVFFLLLPSYVSQISNIPSKIRKRVNVDLSWFTLEGYTTHCVAYKNDVNQAFKYNIRKKKIMVTKMMIIIIIITDSTRITKLRIYFSPGCSVGEPKAKFYKVLVARFAPNLNLVDLCTKLAM